MREHGLPVFLLCPVSAAAAQMLTLKYEEEWGGLSPMAITALWNGGVVSMGTRFPLSGSYCD